MGHLKEFLHKITSGNAGPVVISVKLRIGKDVKMTYSPE